MSKVIPMMLPSTHKSGDKLREYILLEFQGDFEHSNSFNFDGLSLGDLVTDDKVKDAFTLTVSNHLLKGKS